jgi:beta-N-acetylhexosaminidase
MEYDLRTQTSPDPAQIIPLAVDEDVSLTLTPTNEATPASEATPATVEPTPIPRYRIGDTISVRAGPILDHNQHIVPDGTIARFTMSTREESGEIFQQIEAPTVAGVARASFEIDKPGKGQISVVSEPAVNSVVLLQFDFDESNEGAVLTVVAPTPSATPTTPVLPTATVAIPENDLVTPEGYPRLGAWLLVLLAVFGGALLMFWAVSRIVSPRWGLRWALCCFVGGLVAYNYLALGMPGAAEWVASGAVAVGVLLITLIGDTLGALAAWVWMQFFSEPALPAD